MTSVLTQPVLLLNKSWAPMGTVSVQKAFMMLFANRATVIEHPSYENYTWEDWSKLRPLATDEKLKAANLCFKIPEVIRLTSYDRIPEPKLHFSRRNLFKRDKVTCQYCGCKPGSEELTIDHVLPRAQGGITSWENCVLSCIKCNSRKANRTPEQAHMVLAKKPKKPRVNTLHYEIHKPVKSWEAFLGAAYWNVSIAEDDA